MRLLAIATISFSLLVPVVASGAGSANGTASANDGVIESFELEGVHMGMNLDDAIAALTRNGFDMSAPRPPGALVGIRVDGKKVTDDRKGSISILLSSIDGTVYQIQEQVQYWPGRLPEGQTMETLGQTYRERFLKPFENAKYQSEMPNGRIAFDDKTAPPYQKPSITPHAEVLVSSGGRQGFGAVLDITWKERVGASW
jgi:hypothetical protein